MPRFSLSRLRYVSLSAGMALLLAGCSHWREPPGIAGPVSWDRLPGWKEDRHGEAWPALLATCASRVGGSIEWSAICQAAAGETAIDDTRARRFFELWFTPHRVVPAPAQPAGLITGYYEPILNGSLTRTERFRYPLYQKPADLITIDLSSVYPELRGKTLRGRLDGNRVVPYYARAEIDATHAPLIGRELIWLDDPVARFFLQIQGSGRVQLPDGSRVAIGYADQNGHPYVALGKCLIDRGALPRDGVTLKSIREWLAANPHDVANALNCNPSYVFFQVRDIPADAGPLGSLNVSLTPMRSVAVDQSQIPLGVPVWLDTRLPDAEATPLRRLVFAQDTGGAIRGPVRADLFCGQGAPAEVLAGELKQPGSLYVMLPRAQLSASRE